MKTGQSNKFKFSVMLALLHNSVAVALPAFPLQSGPLGNQHVVAVQFHLDLAEHALSGRCTDAFAEDPFEAGEVSFDFPSHPVGGYP